MEFYLGQIFLGGWNFAPRGSTFADGTLLEISQYQALFSLYGTSFGGNGRTNFALPDLRGRVPMHQGAGIGLTSRGIGVQGGTETVTLTVDQLPAHSHSLLAAKGTATSGTADGNALAHQTRGNADVPDIYEDADPEITMHAGSIGSTGGGSSIDNMQPYLVISYCVAMQGVFPSRN